jgi:hypothetical protein
LRDSSRPAQRTYARAMQLLDLVLLRDLALETRASRCGSMSFVSHCVLPFEDEKLSMRA